MKNTKSQTGRSMIEMLGVLAIIGVLSVGGLAGYTRAMRTNRVNNILDYMNHCYMGAKLASLQWEAGDSETCPDIIPDVDAPDGISVGGCQKDEHGQILCQLGVEENLWPTLNQKTGTTTDGIFYDGVRWQDS